MLTILGMGGSILSGNYDTDLLIKIFIALPFLMGVTQYISPSTMNEFAGTTKQGAVDQIMMNWWHSALISWSVLAYSLAVDKATVYESVGRTALIFGLMVIDFNYGRKQGAALNLTDAAKNGFILIQLVIGGGLLKD